VFQTASLEQDACGSGLANVAEEEGICAKRRDVIVFHLLFVVDVGIFLHLRPI
jgi:hypothetical protein